VVYGTCGSSVPVNLTANDTDPENNLPLSLQSITRQSGWGSATITSSSTVEAVFGPAGNTSSFAYTVADSLGATSVGTLLVVTVDCAGGPEH
jgi:hypothetical protein